MMTSSSVFQFGSYFMDAMERMLYNKRQASLESEKASLERKAKTEAWGTAEKVKTQLNGVSQELKSEKKARGEVVKQLAEAQSHLKTERGTCANLRSEIDSLKKALMNKETALSEMTKTLEKVEQEACITYDDCVKRYKESAAFREDVEVEAGIYHEMGFNDCLGFVGVGNAIDLKVHSVECFREAELAKVQETREGDDGAKVQETREGNDGDTVAVAMGAEKNTVEAGGDGQPVEEPRVDPEKMDDVAAV